MIRILASTTLLGLTIFIVNPAKASIINPCEYMNMNSEKMNHMDVGHDENFERIKQQNNQELIRACQEYEIKLLNEAKSSLDRNNY